MKVTSIRMARARIRTCREKPSSVSEAPYGGDDSEAAAQIAARLECGTAWVNQHGVLHPLAPFGGIKSSGLGVEFSVDGLKEYTTIQVMNVAR